MVGKLTCEFVDKKREPLLRRSWLYPPGFNGGMMSYCLGCTYWKYFTTIPHEWEGQDLLLDQDNQTHRLYPNYNTSLLSAVKGQGGPMKREETTFYLKGSQDLMPDQKPFYYLLGKTSQLPIFAPL